MEYILELNLVLRKETKNMKRLFLIALALMMCMTVITGCGNDVVYTDTTELQGGVSAEKGEKEKMTYEAKPTDTLLDITTIKTAEDAVIEDDYATREPESGETVAILHTNMGDIKMRFLDKVAPLATNNFIALAEAGRYDKTIFHRVINNFMIQGGDYTNFNGTGGASAYGTEFVNEVSEYASNVRGSVAMANAGPDTNGSQFYINQCPEDNTYLDGGYTVFGWVYEGMDVVDDIASVQTSADKPLDDVIIEYVEILEY